MTAPLRSLLAVALVAGSIALVAAPASPVEAIDVTDNTPWTLPTRPPLCTKTQADTGNVAGCLLALNYDPAASGWGTPPAPGVGDGWVWKGNTYNGSPALASWEATYITENKTKVGTVPPGVLDTNIGVWPLFEGFIAEISANGYKVKPYDVSGYTFRCTGGSNLNGWKCAGDVSDLSNHAWGLAVDMNSAANPADRTYVGTEPLKACATPMTTDIPRWVVQTAEKWGLYWGGYGWNSGCESPGRSARRCSATHLISSSGARRPRPTPSPSTTAPPTPASRCGIHRCTASTPSTQPARRSSGAALTAARRPAGGSRSRSTCRPRRAPSSSTSPRPTPTVGGYLTAEDCKARPDGDRATSNTNYAVGRDAANLAIVPIVDGRICIYRSTAVHSIVDVVGYLTEDVGSVSTPATWFTPSAPTRLDDTRSSGACSPTGECVTGRLPADGLLAVDLGDVPTAVANLTVVDAVSAGYVSAGACETVAAGAQFSNVNYQAAASANLSVITGDSTGRMCVYSHSDADVIVDRVGTLDRSAGYGWKLTAPKRVIDTRATSCAGDGRDAHPARRRRCGAVLNVTITGSQGAGYATIGPCSTMAPNVEPKTSTVNYGRDTTVANMAFVEAGGGGEVCVFTYAAAHVIVDVQAELVTEHKLGLVTVAPKRVHDSRTA